MELILSNRYVPQKGNLGIGRALYEASLNGHEDVVNFLVDAEPERTSWELERALEGAASKGYLGIVDALTIQLQSSQLEGNHIIEVRDILSHYHSLPGWLFDPEIH